MAEFDEFHPMNALEEALVAAQAGEIGSTAFMETLVASRVHILVDQEFAESRDPSGVKPLILEGGGGEALLALFTAAARGMPMSQDNPEFPFSVEVSFAWAVGSTGDGMGLVINPGWDTGVTIPPAAVSAMKGGG